MSDPITQVQMLLLNLLLSDPALTTVPIMKFKDQVVLDLAAEATVFNPRVAGIIGMAIQVQLPSIRAKTPNVPGPQLELESTIRIFEDPLNNNTGLTAESVGLEVLEWLQEANIGQCQIMPDTRGPALKPVYDYPDRFTYDAVFRSEFPQSSRYRSQQCSISEDGNGNFLLACPDGAATIYYTTDGTIPIIGVSPVYSAPVPAVVGTVVNAYSWKVGTPITYLPSFILTAIIT